MGKNDLKKIIDFFWLFYHWLKHDDLSQNLFLEVKKPEIKETKGTFIIPKLKSSYWGPFRDSKVEIWLKHIGLLLVSFFAPGPFVFHKIFMEYSFYDSKKISESNFRKKESMKIQMQQQK